MSFIHYFSPDYFTARERFLTAAAELQGEVTQYAFDARGPADEPLAMDVVRLGPPNPSRLVIVSSGLHGVEGFFGSAAQLAWLQQRAAAWSPSPETGLLMIHGLNPYGFAWRRRWNENNVDLNRNFLRGDPLTDSPDYEANRAVYARLDPLLNPQSPPPRFEPYGLVAFLRLLRAGYGARQRLLAQGKRVPPATSIGSVAQLGLVELQKALPVGQRENPKGLFYCGDQPEQTVRIVRDAAFRWVGGAQQIIHLDVHTGLGRYGRYKLLLVDEVGSQRAQRVEEIFGPETVVPRGEGSAYFARGQMIEDLRVQLPDRDYYGITAEFGTYPSPRVLRALRAENRAHHYGSASSAGYEAAKQQLVEAFCPASARWRNGCIDAALKLIDQALEAPRGA